jgi:hypothetical protein
LALATLAGVTVLLALVSEIFVESCRRRLGDSQGVLYSQPPEELAAMVLLSYLTLLVGKEFVCSHRSFVF